MTNGSRMATAEASGVDPDRHTRVKPPMLGLPVLRWEYRDLYEKNERFNIVIDKEGNPVVGLSWVVIYLQCVDGSELELEVDRREFDTHLFPQLIYPSLLFWRQVKPGDELYAQRGKWLPRLEEWNDKLESR
jgi:hypothetical protein